MSLTLVSGPAVEPVTLAQMKLQCGFGPMEDTDQFREQTLAEQLRSAVTSARQYCEGWTARAFITQNWRLTLDRFPHFSPEYEIRDRQDILLPLPKFQALTAFSYADYAGVTQDMMAVGSWGYQLVSGGDTRAAKLRPPMGRGWPVTHWQTAESVSITFTCGFGDTAASVPAAIRDAIKLHAQWIFEGAKGAPSPAIAMLLSPYQEFVI